MKFQNNKNEKLNIKAYKEKKMKQNKQANQTKMNQPPRPKLLTKNMERK